MFNTAVEGIGTHAHGYILIRLLHNRINACGHDRVNLQCIEETSLQ